MAQETIGIGTAANDGTGDPIRTAFTKCNDNFTELYSGPGGKTLDIDGTMAADSDTHIPSQKAVVTYVAAQLAAAVAGLLDLKGGQDCSANPNYPAASKGDAYVVTVAGKIGGASGTSVSVGDVYFATADNAGGDQATVGASWDALIHSGSGLTAASGSDVQAGTSTTKAVTPSALAGSAAPQVLTDGATIAWDMSLGYNAKVTLGGNRTLGTPTNPIAGIAYSLNVIQDATGGRTMTWPAAFDWGTTGAPTLTTTASKRDRITLFCTDAATPKFDAFLSGKGFS